jgi:two-component system LytT family response regulator
MNELSTLIIEDEVGAAIHLRSLLESIDPNIVIRSILPSVEEAVEWIASGPSPNLAFFDIQLEDGISFEIFKRCNISFPVIFTTAYDQCAIEAFKVNSIDYLLKPIKEGDLRYSISKYKDRRRSGFDPVAIQHLVGLLKARPKTVTLIIRSKDKLIPVAENDFAYFNLENGIVKGNTQSRQSFHVDQTIDELVEQLDKQNFFKTNRQTIVNRSVILEAEYYFNGRLALKLLHAPLKPVLISKARVQIFKEWWATGFPYL